jgi:serine/threonine protein kinase
MAEPVLKNSSNRMIGRYRLLQQVAKGGVGVVYQAEHLELGIAAAIKVLHPQFSDDAAIIERFRREARVLLSLRHPNVVNVHDFGRDLEFGYYYAMEYLEGQTLLQLMREYPSGMPEPKILEIMGQICNALKVAHDQGICHRDVQPANIYLIRHLDREHFVKILDFGIAKGVPDSEGDLHYTAMGQVFGTPRFMSPEQARGDPDVDARADIYAVGILAFWMLTGQFPYKSRDPEQILRAQMNEPTPTLSSKRRTRVFPADLEMLVADAMAKDRDDRPRTIQSFLDRLQGALAPRPSESAHASAASEAAQSVDQQQSFAGKGATSDSPARAPASTESTRRLVLQDKLGEDEIGVTMLGRRIGVRGFSKSLTIKQLHPHLTRDPGVARWLVAELNRAARLDHPGLLATHDIEQNDSQLAVLYERFDGRPLAQLMSDMSAEGIVYVLVQVLHALAYAHARGFVHGDITTDRILVSRDGRVKLSDVGVGRVHARLSRKGAAGEPSPLDDLEVVGLLLFEGLTGFPATESANDDRRLPPVKAFVADVNPDLAAVAERATHIDPEQRYGSADELRQAIMASLMPATEDDLRQATCEKLDEDPTSIQSSIRSSSSSRVVTALAEVYVLAIEGGPLFAAAQALSEGMLHGAKAYQIRLLTTREDSDAALARLRQREALVHAVVFDGLHVAMSHPLIAEVRSYPEVRTILALESPNDELLTMAVNLCGLDAVLQAPFDRESLVKTIGHVSFESLLCRRLFDAQKELARIKKRERETRTQLSAVAAANMRAVELMSTLEEKNRLIEEKNLFLERIGRAVLNLSGDDPSVAGADSASADSDTRAEPEGSEGQSNARGAFLRGTLDDLSLVDLIQLLVLSRKTARLALSGAQGEQASVCFDDGSIIDAEFEDTTGEAALATLLSWSNAAFAVNSLDISTVERRISRDPTTLLMDLMSSGEEYVA